MKSKAYWVKRAVEVETYLQSQADSVKDGVIKAYERAIKNVNNDIEKTFRDLQQFLSDIKRNERSAVAQS